MHLGQGVFRAGQDPASATAEAQEEKSLLDRTIANFMAKIKSFYDNYNGLKLQRTFVQQHPELQADYNALMTRGSKIDAAIQNAKNLLNEARSAWDSFWRWLGLGDNELGAVPAVAVAVAAAAAAIALITKWLADVFVFAKKLEAIKALEAKGGITAREAAAAIQQATPTGVLDVLQRNIIWVVIGGALLMFGPELMKMLQRGRR